jgi:hypothetical protein
MKKTTGFVGGIALSLLTITVNAQQTWEAKNNATVDSITAKYKDKMLAERPASTINDIFPVLGKYESAANTDAPALAISLDEQNKGVVWIAGLPQGKIKATLRKSPATYKIPVQKTEDGKEVAEGTLIFDKETNTLRICIGKVFDTENPEAAFTAPVAEEAATGTKTARQKKVAAPKPWIYAGTKIAKETAAN